MPALTSIETMRRAEEMLGRLGAGERPAAAALAGAVRADAWATIAAADVYRIGALVRGRQQEDRRPRIVPLLAIDRSARWALVLADDAVTWWVLGDSLSGGSAPADDAAVIRLARAWA